MTIRAAFRANALPLIGQREEQSGFFIDVNALRRAELQRAPSPEAKLTSSVVTRPDATTTAMSPPSKDDEGLALRTSALEMALTEVTAIASKRASGLAGLRTIMSVAILLAAHEGEGDPARLKQLALDAVTEIY
jgi:hypothetical protein